MSYENLCMHCMRDTGGNNPCPHCNFKNESPQLPPFLPTRTVIGGRYLIGTVSEANGDGVTYMAFDMERKIPVKIREFLPDTIATRTESNIALAIRPGKEQFFATCKNNFLDMWRKLARMRGLSALILVIDIIEENNTAYAVSEYMPGAVTLRDYLLASKTGYMSWEEARIMFMPVLSTLSTLHSAGIIHRGISPNTLYVCPDHKIRIGGFSIPECRNTGSGIAAEIFAGYAPVEQFGVKAPSGPWTDIYAFAAVLYRSLIGSTPIESTVRMNNDRMMIPAKFAEQIPAYVINALINALQIMPEDRTKTIEQFRAELSASPAATIASDYIQPPASPAPRAPQQPPRNTGAGVPNSQAVRPTTAAKDTSQKKKGVKLDDKGKKTALISGAIVAGVAILIFVILCFTVLRGHIGVGNNTPADDNNIQSEETVQVPTFTGRTYSSISSQKGYFKDFDIVANEEFNSEVKNGYVISQSIDAGTEVPKGTKIELVVSKGIEQIVMINVVGETYEAASAKLTEAGFKCEKLDKANTGTQTSGTVASTNLSIGEQYNIGTVVKLQVWSDVETTEAESTSAAE